ncbi:MAG: LysE family translocator [Propionibacteriales bacterium]|nr:LysE family translocator [Propionibacteriales bacterium]
MITVDQLLAFGLAALVLIAIPGPSVVFVIGRALAYGRSVALMTVLGNSLGLLVIVGLVTVGLSALLERSVLAFTVLKLAGAAYLVWLGVQAVRHRRDLSMSDVDGAAPRTPLPLRTALRQGIVVGLTNPKAFMIFAAVLPQFVDRGAGHVPVQMLLLGLVAFTIALLGDGLWAVVAGSLRSWFARSPRRGEAVGALGGASMVGLGVALAVTGHRR